MQSDFLAEADRGGIAAVLATNTQLNISACGASTLGTDFH